MRALLEVIASGVVESFLHIRVFIESTLKYTLCYKQRCHYCLPSQAFNDLLFGVKHSEDPQELIKTWIQLDLYLQTFTLEAFSNIDLYLTLIGEEI